VTVVSTEPITVVVVTDGTVVEVVVVVVVVTGGGAVVVVATGATVVGASTVAGVVGSGAVVDVVLPEHAADIRARAATSRRARRFRGVYFGIAPQSSVACGEYELGYDRSLYSSGLRSLGQCERRGPDRGSSLAANEIRRLLLPRTMA
jgi:hypothetical protein